MAEHCLTSAPSVQLHPFFGELGSVNPMFILPGAAAERGEEIGRGWAASLSMGAGQFCTNPGIVVVMEGETADKLIDAAKVTLAGAAPQTMLTDGIAVAYQEGQKRISHTPGVRSVLTSVCDQRQATPYLYETDGSTWLADSHLVMRFLVLWVSLLKCRILSRC